MNPRLRWSILSLAGAAALAAAAFAVLRGRPASPREPHIRAATKRPRQARLRWSLLTLAGVAAAAAAVGLALFAGGFDAAADRGWSQPATWLIHRTMINSVKARSGEATPPARFTPAQVEQGFRLYDTHCAMCHGGPGLGRQPWTAGLEPSPPYLIDTSRRWSRSDLYWIIRHGVKMSGMPAWGSRISSADAWSLVAFLEALPGVTPADYARMRERLAPQR